MWEEDKNNYKTWRLRLNTEEDIPTCKYGAQWRPSWDPSLHVVILEGHFKIVISLNMYVAFHTKF